MEDINAKVLQEGYGLKLYSAQRGRGSFICKTDKGLRELRKYNGDEKRIRFENDVRMHLIAHGFSQTAPFCKGKEGAAFFFLDGNYYVVEEYTEGQTANLEELEQLLLAAATLAKFHEASRGIQRPVWSQEPGGLLATYEKRINELGRIRKWIARRGTLSDMDLLVMKNAACYQEKIRRAAELLEKAGYEKQAQAESQEGGLCHNAYKGDNIRLLHTGGLYVTGLYQCVPNLAMVDLSEFIRRHVKSDTADKETVAQALAAYHQVRAISESDKNLLVAMLTYPYKFVKLCNEYYNKRRVYVSDAMVQKMERCIVQQEKIEGILKQVFS